MINVINYNRVSTDDQKDGYSPEIQSDRMTKHAISKGYNVLMEVVEDYSAKTFERPAFRKLLEYIKQNRKKVDKLVFVRWDRFSRNATDALMMIRKLKNLGVECEAVEQPLDLSIPENKFLLMFYTMSPEVENDRRSLNVTGSMRRAMKLGRYCGTAPFGYRSARDAADKPVILINEEKAALVRQAFQLYATGQYDKQQIRRMLKKKGMTLARAPFSNMFHNPLYCGKLFVKAFGTEPAEVVQGIHEAIVSEELFMQVQLRSKGKKMLLSKPKAAKEELPLRGFLICPVCGGNMTGSASRSSTKQRHFYYHCQPGCKTRYRADRTNEAFEDWLDHISLKPEYVEEALKVMNNINRNEQGNRKQQLAKVEAAIADTNAALIKADKKFINDEIEKDAYQRLKESYQHDLFRLNTEKNNLKEWDADFLKEIEFAMQLVANLRKLWVELDLEGRRTFLGSMFSGKFYFDGKTYRTVSKEKSLPEILRFDAGLEELLNEKASKNGGQYRMVVPTRIELVSKV